MQGVEGIRLFMQPAQDISVGGRLSRTQYQYTLSDPDGRRAEPMGAEDPRQAQAAAAARRRDVGRRRHGLTATLTYDKEQAARYGIQPAQIDSTLDDAFGQREVAQFFTGLKAYYVILEVTPDSRARWTRCASSTSARRRARWCRSRPS